MVHKEITHLQIMPNYPSQEIHLLKEYFEFNKKYCARINDDIKLQLSDHPLWGPFLMEQWRGHCLEQHARAHALLRAAIYNGLNHLDTSLNHK